MKFVYISKCFLLRKLKFQLKYAKLLQDLELCEFPLNCRQFPNGLYIFKGGEMSRIYYAIIEGVCYKVLNHDLLWFVHIGYRHANYSLCNINDAYLSAKGLKMKRFASEIYESGGLDKLSNLDTLQQRVHAYKRRKAINKAKNESR